jgi:hypothetical protein
MKEDDQTAGINWFKMGCCFESISLFEGQTASFLDAILFSLSARLPVMRRKDPPRDPRAAGSKRKPGLAISRVLSCLFKWINTAQ